MRSLSSSELEHSCLEQVGLDPVKAEVRLNWVVPEKPEIEIADLIEAAKEGLIRPEEFRKNAVKFGWELWEKESESQLT